MPIQRTAAVPVKIQNAISLASERTGARFDYLLNTAKRESSLRSGAKSSTSSAAGLFQFVEGTWLKVVKEDGARLGLSSMAKNIHKTSSGRYYVPNRHHRKEILALRHDPKTSALVAAAYTEHNEKYVRRKIGRTPNDGELYLAHFLGPGSAARMIRLAERQPDAPANRHFPAAAKSNKSIFYHNGKPRSLAQVKEILISSHLEGSSDGARQTSYGAFDFGMGSLMSDVSGSSVSYGRGASGSIGVWGGSGEQAADAKTAQNAAGSKAASVDHAAQDNLRKHAARQYQTAANADHASKTEPTHKWVSDAFGDD